jgi:hypothetical protein
MNRKKMFFNASNSIIPLGNLIGYMRFRSPLTQDEKGNLTLSFTDVGLGTGIFDGIANHSAEITYLTNDLAIADNNLISFGNGTSDVPFSFSFCSNVANYGNIQGSVRVRYLFVKRGASTNREFQLGTSNNTANKLIFIQHDQSSGGNIGVQGGTSLVNSTNYHFTVTSSGSGSYAGLKIYINGVLETLTNVSSGSYTAMENLGEDLKIGNALWSSGVYIEGRTQGFGIWDKELTQEEITAIYDKQSGGNEIL